MIDLYFDNDESNIDEIIDKAYVSTSDRNDFDRELEAMLKSRLCLLEISIIFLIQILQKIVN